MPKTKLTDVTVKNLRAGAGERIDHFDAALPGFGLRVAGPTPTRKECHRSWFLYYRFGGVQKRLTIDTYPAVSLADARARAVLAKQAIERGEDPGTVAMDGDAEPDVDTVGKVAADFMKRHRYKKNGTALAPRYIEERERTFELHVLPAWKDRPLKSITKREIIELTDKLVDAGKPVAANRMLAQVSAMFTWAVRRGLLDVSPCSLMDKPGPEPERDRVLDDTELRRVWEAAQQCGNAFGAFVKMALLTGQRRTNVARMRWQDIDLEQRIWTIPLMKSGHKGFMVPLSDLALQTLVGIPRIEVETYVFSTRNNVPISGFSAGKRALDKAIGEPALADWRIHDLRRSTATGMARLKVSRFDISQVLDRVDSSMTGIYDRHDYLEQKRTALDAWGAHLRTIVEPPPPSNVLQLHNVA
jgi:integrase